MWIGMLFTILSTAISVMQRSGDPIPIAFNLPENPAWRFRQQAVHSMILADYPSIPAFTLETMLFYICLEYQESNDSRLAIADVVSMVVCLALRMGYHRDPSHSPKISPFEGEVRRRVWLLLRHVDLLFSLETGLPGFIRNEQCDTKEPLNLTDEDIYPSMVELPPPRPLSEPTHISFMIIKNGLVSVDRKIIEHLANVNPTSYERVLSLDKQLQEVHDAIPPNFRMKAVDQMVIDSGETLIKRFYLEFHYQKARCQLHRQFLSKNFGQSEYAFSRKVCVEGALSLLDNQAFFHGETRIGNRLYQQRKLIYSFTSNFFLTAAMILCVKLSSGVESEEDKNKMLSSLIASHGIWCAENGEHALAHKAADIMSLMIRKVQENSIKNRPRLVVESPSFNRPGAGPADANMGTASNGPTPQTNLNTADMDMDVTWDDFLDMPVDIDWVRVTPIQYTRKMC